MPYTPQAGDEGMQLFFVGLRDYIATNTGITDLLPNGAASIIPEGTLTPETELPVILIANNGDGEADVGRGVQIVRLILYVMDRGRGYYNIEIILHRLRNHLNNYDSMADYLTFPADEIVVYTLAAKGTTNSGTYPQWQCEGRGVYLFANIGNIPTSI